MRKTKTVKLKNFTPAPPTPKPERQRVALEEIREPLVELRKINEWLVDQLSKALNGRRKRLDPVKLWRNPEGALVLLDGAHRVEAYRVARITGDIPALVFTCSRDEAVLAAVADIDKIALPLTAVERSDLAWRLVRDGEVKLSKSKLAQATGVSARTVGAMRLRLRAMKKAGKDPTGFWLRDRLDVAEEPKPMMTDKEKEEMTEAMAKRVLEAIDMRKDSPFVREREIVFDAILRALGHHADAFVDYVGGACDPHGIGCKCEAAEEYDIPLI
ncbi:hypothetical protein [Haematobacter missouriensis]|uniref:hypothetical protein n=1 Tax=Haematobacter missouriensis TaxID=366616 RepID=UPI0023F4DA05|nr:hypothetical protein [Haematobacter missouriensis]